MAQFLKPQLAAPDYESTIIGGPVANFEFGFDFEKSGVFVAA